MPRLRQVSRAEATDYVRRYYDRLFGERDPVESPGTATGTPGNWWTVFALVPYVFEHATQQFGMFGMFADEAVSRLDPRIREIAILRTGYVQASQFVYSQHCKAARRFNVTEAEITAIPAWSVERVFGPKERAVLAYVDGLVLEGGRVPDALFEELKRHFADEDILELTYHVLCYNLHAVSCKALRLEYDDVPERIREVPVPQGEPVADWAGRSWAG